MKPITPSELDHYVTHRLDELQSLARTLKDQIQQAHREEVLNELQARAFAVMMAVEEVQRMQQWLKGSWIQ